MTQIPDDFQDLLADETKAFAVIGTTMDDHSPQVTPVWFNTDGDDILINSAVGRVKDRNIRERPQVAVMIMDLDRPYRYLQIRGEVVEITTEGAEAHIHALSNKYRGKDYVIPEGQQRVTYRVRPLSVDTMG